MSQNIQHKQTFGASSGFGRSDNGERVPIVSPPDYQDEAECGSEDESKIRQEVIVKLLSNLLHAGNSDEIGRKVLILSYALKLPDAPRTLEELGARCNPPIGKARVSQILSKLNLQTGDFTKLLP